MQRSFEFFARVDGLFKIIENIRESAYKLKVDDYNMSLTSSVKDLRPYHDEDMWASLFFIPTMGIDVGASTPIIGDLGLIMENSILGGCEALET